MKKMDMELLARIDERQTAMDDKIDSILTQTTKTNGRVTALENWRSQFTGAYKALTIMSAIISFIVGVLLTIYFT